MFLGVDWSYDAYRIFYYEDYYFILHGAKFHVLVYLLCLVYLF